MDRVAQRVYAEITEEMIDNGVIKGPGCAGRMAPIARTDVVGTAVGILTADAPPNGPINLTGPEALILADMARIYAEVTDSPAHYVEETLEEAYASRASPNLSNAAWRGIGVDLYRHRRGATRRGVEHRRAMRRPPADEFFGVFAQATSD